jgi:hypothetical protein
MKKSNLTVTWKCYNSDDTEADGSKEGARKCEHVGMYGNDSDNEAIADPRKPRPVATARFELYWAWSQYYDKHNWIMLIDTRDAHFQLNPFSELDHDKNQDIGKDDGLLYFFAVSWYYAIIVFLSYGFSTTHSFDNVIMFNRRMPRLATLVNPVSTAVG